MQTGIQRAIAQKTGLSEGYISMVINGSRRVKIWDTAKKIANVTGTEVELWLEQPAENIKGAISKLKIEDLNSISDQIQN